MARGLTPEGAVSPTGPSDYVHCGRRRRAGPAPGRHGWALAAPALRGGRVQISVPPRPGPPWWGDQFERPRLAGPRVRRTRLLLRGGPAGPPIGPDRMAAAGAARRRHLVRGGGPGD